MTERLHVLTAIYQSDRADRSSTLTVSLATMGAAVTYLVGTIAFYDKLDLLGWAISLLPFPLICVLAFQAQMVNLAGVRARSILILEKALLDAVEPAGGPGLDRSLLGVTASERASNPHTSSPWHRAATLIAYAGVGLIDVLYVVLMLIKAAGHLSAWVAVPAAVYGMLLVLVALAWHRSVTNLDFSTVTVP
ncbi:hypothetical protein EES37_36620 [Streptomyces sp. ADI91-18]|uniref:hypothetical protein n=1 Tax=Streptomyces sp. ADI91-18 TaxID=1522755 RepID=UPI000F9DD5D0|nr:hypothetical protein [Streptomyces sp. ADI91-18]RPK27544.1 hypothetical protein EES37_36620 [Streptomyces sp. ADI91-18]